MAKNRLLHHLKIEDLPNVDEKLANRFHKLGIYTARDLLLHMPLRYEDKSTITPIANAPSHKKTAIIGKIISTNIVQGRKKMFLCQIQDETGIINLRFMHFYPSYLTNFKIGKWLKAYGEIKQLKFDYEMIQPSVNTADDRQKLLDKITSEFTPIYPTTTFLKQNIISKYINLVLDRLNIQNFDEVLPQNIANQFYSLQKSLAIIHNPPLDADLDSLSNNTHKAKKRIIFEELLAYLISIELTKIEKLQLTSVALKPTNKLITPFLKSLPYQPTNAQSRVIDEIWQDLTQQKPMMRLVQGDVGSGKTLVATLAALTAIENNQQAVIMAPTEILAEQHFLNLSKMLAPFDIKIALLTGSLTKKQKLTLYNSISAGQINLVIGTHAVFSKDVEFKLLGLVIIDEQHRFGVAQRFSLLNKGKTDSQYPHQLIMTATPIPRTLAMTIYADLAISTIDELPPGRTPIQTIALPNTKRNDLILRIKEHCLKGTQVYWVCTLIEDSETLTAQAAQDTYELLKAHLPEINIGLIHGKMKANEKQAIMNEFKNNTLQLLVATTVIEVGVDVPNATLMIIENAERLGLSQLHQLRGRVGRGKSESHCVLLYQSPLGKTAKSRIDIMRKTTDGFLIAQKDLELRGSGDFLGTNQIGMIGFKVADFVRDSQMLAEVEKTAVELIKNSPNIAKQIADDWLANKSQFIHA